MKTLLYIFILSFLFISCGYFTTKQNEKDEVVAEVDGRKLLLSEISSIFPPGMAKTDSLELLKNYVNTWARKYLMAAKAEKYLSKGQKNVSMELEDYRLSLLSFRYENQYVAQKMDTIVTVEELDAFLEKNAANYLLTKPCVKVTYVQVREDAKLFRDIKRAVRSKDEDMKLLDSLCATVEARLDYFSDKWVDFDYIVQELPFQEEQCKYALQGNGYIEVKNKSVINILYFRSIKKAGDVSPLEYVRDNIYHTIISQRKRNMIRNLENSAYNEALDHKRLKIYIK
jgi:hypothetical protein